MKKTFCFLIPLLVVAVLFTACGLSQEKTPNSSFSISEIPPFSGDPYVVICDNMPEFTQEDMTTQAYERYSDLDRLHRCGYAMACVGQELMPQEERGSIGQVKPSGWQTVKYDIVDGKYLYNRCHLIGYQLTGEKANEKNLITGTRYMNVEGMLPFENMVADYVKETDNHVLYRVTPIFEGKNMVASGVQMEAWSVEDDGQGICYHVYVYNNQPGIIIDYATGESRLESASISSDSTETYILNKNSKKFHKTECKSVTMMSEDNKETFVGTREWIVTQGYTPCGECQP